MGRQPTDDVEVKSNFKLGAAAASLLLLASCGGGSSSSPAPSASSSTGTSAPTSAPSSSAGSPQASAFAQINAARTACGFNALAQAAELDRSASAHAAYMAQNNSYGHDEVQGKPGFTGVQFSDRETAAGYRWSYAGEVLAQVEASATGADAIRELLAAPYHAALLLDAFRDIGFGWSMVSGFPTLTGDLGTRMGVALPQVQGVVTYPCDGIADAVAVSGAESPSPFPSNPSARWGQPVSVRGPSDMTLDSVSITGPAGSVQVQAIYGDGQAPDPNATGDFTRGTFSIIPAALSPATTYSVSIGYTTGGVAGSTRFSFTTAR